MGSEESITAPSSERERTNRAVSFFQSRFQRVCGCGNGLSPFTGFQDLPCCIIDPAHTARRRVDQQGMDCSLYQYPLIGKIKEIIQDILVCCLRHGGGVNSGYAALFPGPYFPEYRIGFHINLFFQARILFHVSLSVFQHLFPDDPADVDNHALDLAYNPALPGHIIEYY